MHKKSNFAAVKCLRNPVSRYQDFKLNRNILPLLPICSSPPNQFLHYNLFYSIPLQVTIKHICLVFIADNFANMCKQYLCSYRDCGHTEEYGLLACSREKKFPGTCRHTEIPDTDNDTGLCERCRQYELNRPNVRRRGLYDRRHGDDHSGREYNHDYQKSWLGNSRGDDRYDFSDRASHYGPEDEEWEIIERAPGKRQTERNGSQDSWGSGRMSSGSGESVRSWRSNGSERRGRRSRR